MAHRLDQRSQPVTLGGLGPPSPAKVAARPGSGRSPEVRPGDRCDVACDGRHMLPIGDYTVDLRGLVMHGPSGSSSLSAREGDLLEYLAARVGEAVPTEELLINVWNYAPGVQSRAVYHTVARLRRRLEPDPSRPQFLISVRGVGFRLDLGPASPRAPVPSPPASSLPRRRTRFFGRTNEIEQAVERLRDSPSPLVTVLGLGGIGKTRVALEIAERLQDDIARTVFCEVPRESHGVIGALGRALDVRVSSSTGVETLAKHLEVPGGVLLVLDNATHDGESAAELISHLIEQCPSLRVLATSREAMRLHGEARILLDVMPLPDVGGTLAKAGDNPAVQLFVDRVVLHDPRFSLTHWLPRWPPRSLVHASPGLRRCGCRYRSPAGTTRTPR